MMQNLADDAVAAIGLDAASISVFSSNVAAVTRVSNTDLPAQVEAVGDVVGVARISGCGAYFSDQFHCWSSSSENEKEYCMLSTSQRAPG